MRNRGFTLIELLIVILIIAILASLSLAAVFEALHAAKETSTQRMMSQLETASEVYRRDPNAFPPAEPDVPFGTGPMAFALSQAGPKKEPYMYFREGDVTSWPMTSASQVRNAANPSSPIRVRDNTHIPKPAPAVTPFHNLYGLDFWAENHYGVATGINNSGEPR